MRIRKSESPSGILVGVGGLSKRAEIMFDVLMNILVILSFGFPAMPWLFLVRDRVREAFGSVQDLPKASCFPILFWVACGACGQGAIAIFVLGPIWIVSALLTVTSAAFAYFKFAR